MSDTRWIGSGVCADDAGELVEWHNTMSDASMRGAIAETEWLDIDLSVSFDQTRITFVWRDRDQSITYRRADTVVGLSATVSGIPR